MAIGRLVCLYFVMLTTLLICVNVDCSDRDKKVDDAKEEYDDAVGLLRNAEYDYEKANQNYRRAVMEYEASTVNDPALERRLKKAGRVYDEEKKRLEVARRNEAAARRALRVARQNLATPESGSNNLGISRGNRRRVDFVPNIPPEMNDLSTQLRDLNIKPEVKKQNIRPIEDDLSTQELHLDAGPIEDDPSTNLIDLNSRPIENDLSTNLIDLNSRNYKGGRRN